MSEEKEYLIHPQIILLYLLIAAIAALFLGFSFSFLFSRINSNLPAVKLPNLFYLNALLLIGSSICLHYAKQFFIRDQTARYKTSILTALILSCGFLGLQVVAWMELYEMNVFLQSNNLGPYLYLISAVHMLHVLAGIPFLAAFYIKALKKMHSPVTVLVYFSDPQKRRKLYILTKYWHFLDVLWLYLLVFFLVNYFIK